MKKHGLLKILGSLLLLVVIVSFCLNGRSGAKDYIGLGDVVLNNLKSVYYFFYVVLFILAVGGFYGILNKVPAYKKLLDNIVKSFKPLGKKIIFIIILVFAVIAALTGMTLPLIIFVPFVASIVLLLGYDKLVAMTSTIGSIMVGYIGGVFVTFINPNSYAVTTYETYVGAETQFVNMFPKLLLLFAGIALLIFFVNQHITNVEKKKVKYELNDNSDLLINEVKGNYKNIKTWPLIVALSMLFVVLVLGMFPWNGLFKIEAFSNFHTWIVGIPLTVNLLIVTCVMVLLAFVPWHKLFKNKLPEGSAQLAKYLKIKRIVLLSLLLVIIVAGIIPIKWFSGINTWLIGSKSKTILASIITDLISGDVQAFGVWGTLGDSMVYMLICFILLIFSVITAIAYKVKSNDFFEGLVEGMKKMLPIAALVIISYTVLVCSYTNGFLETLIKNYGKFNYGISSLFVLLGSILNVDIYYVVIGVFAPIVEQITDKSIYPSVAVLFQGIYGIFNLVGPTSLILIFGLTYLDIPYTTWLKYAWRFILGLLVLVALVVLLVVLL